MYRSLRPTTRALQASCNSKWTFWKKNILRWAIEFIYNRAKIAIIINKATFFRVALIGTT